MDYLVVPQHILKRTDLTATDKLVISVIRGLDKEKGCYCSNQYIADLLGLSKGTIANIISKLSKMGLIDVNVKNFNERTIKYLGVAEEIATKQVRENSKVVSMNKTPAKVQKFNQLDSHEWDFDEIERLERERINRRLNGGNYT